MSTPPKGRGMGRGLGALGLGAPVQPAPATDTPREKPAVPASPAPAAPNGASGGKEEPARGDLKKTGLVRVPITMIAPNPYQPRKHIDPDVLAELAQSIRENGLIQPPVVSYNPDYDPDYKETDEEETGPVKKERKARYLLIAGERRWQASKLAGITELPVVVKEASPIQMLELALVENIQRADLNPLEEAEAYKQLMHEFKLTQEAVAQKVGKSRAAVANALRLFDLPKEVREALYRNDITEGHARAILMVRGEGGQRKLLHDVIAKQLSVRQTEEMARRINALAALEGYLPGNEPVRQSPAERETRQLEEQFQSALGHRVNLSRSNKGGKLVIQFFSDEELNDIFNKIVGPDI